MRLTIYTMYNIILVRLPTSTSSYVLRLCPPSPLRCALLIIDRLMKTQQVITMMALVIVVREDVASHA